ncbi:helix-turn-helix domain-containing protein [Roseibium aggregatum]|uniref:helix-turn-helix domain-containing protein n=1 Tax=Roseibium aggregatum TaxID=187304 RepID=UPI001E2F9E1C|nr:helix-turn-helix transcriptional regulator [Roseibium aggregatum]UES42142.1 XRE family transcriptional regulator [Roseibium aggregatum]
MQSRVENENRLKTWIVAHIARRIDEQNLSQTNAAALMGLKQPDLSALLNGKFNGFSAERLARCLSAIGGNVRLTVDESAGKQDIFVLEGH